MTVLVLASAASIMSTDMYSPSLPSLTEYFATNESLVQLTISLNLLAFGAAQLVLGPMSDRFGRRPVLLCGLVSFVAATLACGAAPNIEFLIAARIVQGVSASVEAVVGYAVIRDLFHGSTRIRALAIWGMVIAAVPALAPIAGGYVHVLAGWRANFWIIAVAGIVAGVMVWRLLPESTHPDPRALRPARLAANFRLLLGNRTFVCYSMMLGAGLGAIFAFVTAGPFVLVNDMGVAVERVGLVQAVSVTAFGIGSFTAERLARHGRTRGLLSSGVVLLMAGSLVLLLLHLGDALDPLTLTASMALVGLGLGPIFAIVPAVALEAVDAPGGAASAALGSMQMLTAGGASVLVTVLDGGAQAAMVTTAGVCVIAVVVLWRIGRIGAPKLGAGTLTGGS